MYLNLYQPRLQSEKQLVGFFRFHRGHTFASSALMDPMSKLFVSSIYAFADEGGIPVASFRKGERKDDVAKKYLRDFKGEEGIVFIGRAGEDRGVSHRKANKSRDRQELLMDRALNCGGEPLLLLRNRPRFRSFLHQVRHLPPLHRHHIVDRWHF